MSEVGASVGQRGAQHTRCLGKPQVPGYGHTLLPLVRSIIEDARSSAPRQGAALHRRLWLAEQSLAWHQPSLTGASSLCGVHRLRFTHKHRSDGAAAGSLLILPAAGPVLLAQKAILDEVKRYLATPGKHMYVGYLD